MVRKSGFDGIGEGRKYYQHNYIDAVKLATPAMYEDTDFSIYGSEEDILYNMLGKIIRTVDNVSSIISVSSYDHSSLQEHFILRNNYTNVHPYLFNNKIVKAFGVDVKDYTSLDDFKEFVSGTLLPNIVLNKPTTTFLSGLSSIDNSITSLSGAHNYLIENLSWLYFLNTSGPSGGTDPSASVRDIIVSGLFFGSSIQEADGVGLLYRYLWDNREVSSTFLNYLPAQYRQVDASISANIYLSGTQQRDRIETLVDIWYNTHDDGSDTLDTYLDLYLNTGAYTSKKQAAAPFSKFLKAVSFAFYDVNSVVDDLGDLVSIEKCPPQFLQFLASLVGWRLLTGDVDRWRAQLRHAIFLYKKKGTRECLEDAISLVFPNSGFNPGTSGNLKESWECYLPNQIYYLIATESAFLNDPEYRLNPNIAQDIGIFKQDGETPQWDVDNHDNNYRFATDYVLQKVHAATSSIVINGHIFSATDNPPGATAWAEDFGGFNHRGTDGVVVPPWENDRFYDTTRVSQAVLEQLGPLLSGTIAEGGLGVSAEFVTNFVNFVSSNSVDTTFVGGYNGKWKYYLSSLETPSNFPNIVSRGDADSISLLDYWSSKSSVAFTEITISDFGNYLFDGMKIPIGDVMITLEDIVRQFTPFHTVLKLLVTDAFSENIIMADKVDGICMNIVVDGTEDWSDPDFDQGIIADLKLSGVQASSYPYASSSDYSSIPYTAIPRTTHRRRNFKYNIPAARYRRDGFNMPVAPIFESASATLYQSYSSLSGLSGIHTPECIPLGYNFSTGDFWSTTGAGSAIYDASNELSLSNLPLIYPPDPNDPYRRDVPEIPASFYGVDVSNTFAARAFNILEDTDCLSPVVRRGGLKGFREAMITFATREGENAETAVSLSEEGIRNFRFGSDFMRSFYSSRRNFTNTINTDLTVSTTQGVGLNRFLFSGGYGFVDHAFGPLVYNSHFGFVQRIAVGIVDNNVEPALPYGPDSKFKHVPIWKAVAANRDAIGYASNKYARGDGVAGDITVSASIFASSNEPHEPPVRAGRPGTSADSQMFKNHYRVLSTLVDGVEIWGRDTLDDPGADHLCSYAVYNYLKQKHFAIDVSYKTSPGTVSLVTRPSDSEYFTPGTGETFLRFPFKRDRDYCDIGNFNYPISPINPLTDATSLVMFKGLELHDYNRNNMWNGAGYHVGNGGSLTVSAIGVGDTHRSNYLRATVSGEGTRNHSDSALISIPGITGLVPGRNYKLDIASYKDHNSAASAGYVNLINISQGHSWTGSAWASDTSSSYDLTGGYREFLTHSEAFSPSGPHSPNDSYTLNIFPRGNHTGTAWVSSLGTVNFSSIAITEVSSNSDVNFLSPDHEYELTIRAKRGTVLGVGGLANISIGVRVMTDVVPINFDPKSKNNSFDLTMYSFDFGALPHGKWKEFPTGAKYGFVEIPWASFIEEEPGSLWSIATVKFHTKNNHSDTSERTRTTTRRGKKLHHQETPYHIDICKLSRDDTFITFDEVSVVDLTFNKSVNRYTREELREVFTHFNSLVDGKASRDARDSSGTYQTSGGSRDYYLESVGGFSGLGAAASGVPTPGAEAIHLTGVSGIAYEIFDD